MFIDDLVTLLADAGLGVRGTSLFWTSGAVLPAKSSVAPNLNGFLTVQETGGAAPVLMHYSDTTPGYELPTAQIVARANASGPARVLIAAAWNIFVAKQNVFVNGTWYVYFRVAQSPFDLGPDDVGRTRFAFNVRAMKRP